MNAICLVFDRLHAGYLGAYGNSWIETPAFDRLASQAFLFDQAMIDSPELACLYRSYWQGWHALGIEPPESRPALPKLLREAGVKTVLATDEPQVARHGLANDFDELIEINPPSQPPAIATEIEQTHFARCFAQIVDWLETARGPFLLWCHFAGLGTTWDAPLSFRQAYWDEGDPPPPESADVPDRILPADFDPDEVLGLTQAYCGQVSLWDTCLGAFFDFFDGLPITGETLVTATSSRGFPLGEHGRLGECDGALFGEMLHVPWLIRTPDGSGAAARSQSLVEPSDLWATLLDFWPIAGLPPSPTGASLLRIIRQDVDSLRDRLCIAGRAGQRAIRTPAWFLRGNAEPELFTKPDDRWEANNVASRCGDVVERLQQVLAESEAAIQNGRVSDLPPLHDVLRDGIE